MRKSLSLIMTIIICHLSCAYRHTIFLDTPALCNNLTCNQNVAHTACKKFVPNERCFEFKMLDMSRKVIKTMIMGHNGIRNKMATDWGIANMNILHWSRELERLSKYYLMDCQAKRDVCDFLVKKDVTIGHNYYFSKAPPSIRWAGRAIRSWYFELGYEIKTWQQFRAARNKNTSFTEFTQMIWPTTEFVGCAAAEMSDGYLATCYYHPAISKGWSDFAMGTGCTKCSDDRPTCSRDFTKLCGLDTSYDNGKDSIVQVKTLTVLLLPHIIYIILY